MSEKRTGLGRGLDALFPGRQTSRPAGTPAVGAAAWGRTRKELALGARRLDLKIRIKVNRKVLRPQAGLRMTSTQVLRAFVAQFKPAVVRRVVVARTHL